MNNVNTIAARLDQVQQRIATAAQRVGRDPAEVVLLPVSKTFGVDALRQAAVLGLRRFGENKIQEIRQKAVALAESGIDWIMIGHVQLNKVKDVAKWVTEVQSLDRLELAEALDRRLQSEGRAIDVLLQVKTSTEPNKHGLFPSDVPAFLRTMARDFSSLRVRGLMTLAVNSSDVAAVRGCFRQLRQLRDHLQADGMELERLSMGMSGDFELAIEEGSTEVRIGTAIFGCRDDKAVSPAPHGATAQSS
jgi:hypothetical protein